MAAEAEGDALASAPSQAKGDWGGPLLSQGPAAGFGYIKAKALGTNSWRVWG